MLKCYHYIPGIRLAVMQYIPVKATTFMTTFNQLTYWTCQLTPNTENTQLETESLSLTSVLSYRESDSASSSFLCTTNTHYQDEMYWKKKQETAHIPFRLTSASAEEPGEDKVSYINLQYDTRSITKHIRKSIKCCKCFIDHVTVAKVVLCSRVLG